MELTLGQEARAKQLVDEHWKYVQEVLDHAGVDYKQRETIAFHYKSSGIHFYGHAIEDFAKGDQF